MGDRCSEDVGAIETPMSIWSKGSSFDGLSPSDVAEREKERGVIIPVAAREEGKAGLVEPVVTDGGMGCEGERGTTAWKEERVMEGMVWQMPSFWREVEVTRDSVGAGCLNSRDFCVAKPGA